MHTHLIHHAGVESSRLVYGCMRITGDGSPGALSTGRHAVQAAVDAGYNHFDLANIYAAGACETLFGQVLRDAPGLRDQILITSKCGIRGQHPDDGLKRYDFTPEHITSSVEDSLRRLNIDTLDFLLLHRPDYLMDADETADALTKLIESGKVKHLGVSNFKPSQVSLLQSRLKTPLAVNQLEINLHNISSLLDGTLDQCQEHRIAPMAWSPIAGVVYTARGNTFTHEDDTRIRSEIRRQARHYGVDDGILILAWLLKHPARIMPIIGSTSPIRIQAATQALTIEYSREDWYRLFVTRGGDKMVPKTPPAPTPMR